MKKTQTMLTAGRTGAAIHVTGIVQGVGFRPFVYNLAAEFGLTGWVRNTSAGVDIQVDGDAQEITNFAAALRNQAPALASIDQIDFQVKVPAGFVDFQILNSTPLPKSFQPISPDVSVCPDCLGELFDPADRRYLYPFINCTNCGPRFTIIHGIPYDRPSTTMAGFQMCTACAGEYSDPSDRRFHAQPVACPECGPSVWIEVGGQCHKLEQPPLVEAQRMLAEGRVLAIKGLGGFHLACDATNPAAVSALRCRKLRVDKPFALMMADLETVEENCHLDEVSRDLLTCRERPIVILRRKHGSAITPDVAPGQDTLGVMLPYTPLHYLLFTRIDGSSHNSPSPVLVMTSGNLSEEPIAWENEEARERLASLADGFLMHNRPIYTRCDDSVVRAAPRVVKDRDTSNGRVPQVGAYLLRRSRGYSPAPILLREAHPPILATGPELKNTFCLIRDRYALLSHHIGDLENYETLCSFEEGISHFESLFQVQPEYLAYDLHPDYLATRYALERSAAERVPAIGVQHHHAHIAACMAERQLPPDQDVIGIAFDGTGYGQDGAIWGGEFLVANYQAYRRLYHLDYALLPGGDRAVREPWRMALAWLLKAGIPWDEDLPPVAFGKLPLHEAANLLEVVRHQIESGFNAPPTSSMGRLFDAAAALIGLRQTVNYEAQAAIELEAQIDPGETGAYTFRIENGIVDPTPIFSGLVEDLRARRSIPTMAARFHNTITAMVCLVASEIRLSTGIDRVVLSGGVWQNMRLLSQSIQRLAGEGFDVVIHRKVPPNDGGVALGQALIAAYRIQGKESL